MKSPLSLGGSIRYLGLRALPFVSQAWAVHRASGLQFRVHLRDAVGRAILRREGYETSLTDWLVSALGRGGRGLFIDVGANIGWFSLHAAQHRNVVRALAVEPDASNQSLLRQNIERNGLGTRVMPIACALGAHAGMAQLHQYKPSNRGRHSLIEDHGYGGNWVPVLALDELLEMLGYGNETIAACKVDVEGYEPLVLAGGGAALSRTRALLMELSPALSRAGGLDLPAALDLLEAEGFRPETWDGEGTVPTFEGLRTYPDQVTVGFFRQD